MPGRWSVGNDGLHRPRGDGLPKSRAGFLALMIARPDDVPGLAADARRSLPEVKKTVCRLARYESDVVQ